MLPEMKVDNLKMQVTNVREGNVRSPTGFLQTRVPVREAENTEEQENDSVEHLACIEGFKYISTMSSFEDSHFKGKVRKELLKDKDVSSKAFSGLSPASVCGIFKPTHRHD
jgi:hypothetical protein